MKRVHVLLCVTAAILGYIQSDERVFAKTQKDVFPKQFLGRWSGEGRSMGMDSKPMMTWESVLGDKFLRLYFRNEMKTAQGKVEIFEGPAYYHSTAEGKFRGSWFDSGGAAHPINAVFEDHTLKAEWGTTETQLGRTNYRLINPDLIEIVDSVRLKDGTWREFSRTLLKRM